MTLEIITDEQDMLIHRMVLASGEATPWHVDCCHRFTVVIQGDRLRIESEGSSASQEVIVHPGLAEWDRPNEVVHRAVNVGTCPYEEVVTFYRTTPHQDPQPSQ